MDSNSKRKKRTQSVEGDTEAPESDAINRHLGSRVKTLRAERKWSLESLAEASGVSRSMLSQIERERANPTLAVTLRIARAFGMSLGELVETPETAPSRLRRAVRRRVGWSTHGRRRRRARRRTCSVRAPRRVR